MMTDNKKNNGRRSFLTIGLAAGAGLIANTAAAQVIENATKGNPVKMLTPDGKLVEVDPDILARATRKKVSNQEILAWSQSGKDSQQP